MAAASHTTPGPAPFPARVYRDELDRVWVAECMNLPGCVSQGNTQVEALENLSEAIAGVLAVRMQRHLREEPPADVNADQVVELAV
jgi:predicted RNase H-like HicB family nuclease